ncbi:MAG: lipoyl(octanoyl) transferase LipB [Nitrospira sp. CG24D]|nr:MAG: lipoyl(octanoyl) transferase LipB [Nitrospira sp. CG24D]
MTTPIALRTPIVADQPNMPGFHTPTELLWFSSPVRYADAWDLQMRLHHERVMNSRPDTILILEHQPVYTVGRRTLVADWGGDPAATHVDGIEIHHVNRGGSVTYHGPGQLVVYPILRLTDHVRGVRAYVEQLEEAVIQCLRQSGIAGYRKERAPGVWVTDLQDVKITSIGIRVDRGVTMHGLALNVDMDLSPFRGITPCGLQGSHATSMAEVVGQPVSLVAVTYSLLDQLKQTLALRWTGAPAPIEFQTVA